MVTYDVRGAGRSTRPAGRAAYRTELLVEDLVAVLDATVPAGEQVHLVGHDWGCDRRLGGHRRRDLGPPARGSAGVVHLQQRAVPGPSRQRRLVLARPAAAAAAGVAQLVRVADPRPRAPRAGLATGTGCSARWCAGWTRRWTCSPGDRRSARTPGTASTSTAPTSFGTCVSPVAWRTSVPVQLVVATRDPWVTPRAVAGMEARCRRLSRVEVDEGHWLPRARPAEFAGLVAGFVRRH